MSAKHLLGTAIVVAAFAVASAFATLDSASAAPQATGLASGRWYGALSQDLALLDDPYATRFVITAYRGRITGVVATIRMECPGPMIDDARIVKGYRIGQGPRLNASSSFAFAVGDARVTGHLGKTGASGTARANRDGCNGKGQWKAKYIGS